jgi:hypothetical protein
MPLGDVGIGVPEPVPNWQYSRRNTVKITYMSHGKRTPSNLVGRVVSVSDEVVVLLREKTGEPIELNRERVRGIVVMHEGDVAGRTRMAAVRALVKAARYLADPRHVGGNQEAAANQVAMALKMVPALAKGDGDIAWLELRASGVDIS